MGKVAKKSSNKKMRRLQKLLQLLDSSSDSEDSANEQTEVDSESDVPVVNLIPTPLKNALMPNQGPQVHPDIAALLSGCLLKGMDKDSHSSSLVSYPVLANCPPLNPPALNPEVKEQLTSTSLDQDRFICTLQSSLAAGISALAMPLDKQYEMTRLDSREVTRKELEKLSEPIKLFSDVFHSLSIHRRFLILPFLKVGVKRRVLKNLPIDDLLFGRTFANRIKNIQKQIEKSKALKATERKLDHIKPGPSGISPTTNSLNRCFRPIQQQTLLRKEEGNLVQMVTVKSDTNAPKANCPWKLEVYQESFSQAEQSNSWTTDVQLNP